MVSREAKCKRELLNLTTAVTTAEQKAIGLERPTWGRSRNSVDYEWEDMSCKLRLAKLKTWTRNLYGKWGTRKTRGKAKYSDLTPEYTKCSKNVLQLLFSVSIFL